MIQASIEFSISIEENQRDFDQIALLRLQKRWIWRKVNIEKS